MVIQIDFTDHVILDSGYPDLVKDFIFIYVFGFFALFSELFAKFTDIDGTGNLETNYQPAGTEEEEEKEEGKEKEKKENSREVINFEESNGAKIKVEDGVWKGTIDGDIKKHIFYEHYISITINVNFSAN